MQLTRVASSNVSAVGYDPATSTLYVRFNNGGVFTYANVSPAMRQLLMTSPSKGGFVSKYLRGAKQHPCAKLTDEQAAACVLVD